ncbi:MAG: lamin tail domain-containing protein [Saprospiraceae bacterium]|nr:lamin tail domain-containing protein [Saprospiraceae bacterium]
MKKIFTFILFSFLWIGASRAQLVLTEIMYNPPESGVDSLEYIELYNNTNQAIDLTGYSVSTAFVHTFSNVSIASHTYLVLAVDSVAIQTVLGVAAYQWTSGSLNNTGETIEIKDPGGNIIQSVTYADSGAWPTSADGGGKSLELCDVNADSSAPTNWKEAGASFGIFHNGIEVFASPGAPNNATCSTAQADHTVNVQNYSFTPADITINVGESVEWVNLGGTHNINGTQATFPNNPESFTNGSASSSAWTYTVTFTVAGYYQYQCDPHANSGMIGSVTVLTPVINNPYPLHSIASLITENAEGVSDSLNVKAEIRGVVHGINIRSVGTQFTLIDIATNTGIAIYNGGSNLGYDVVEGDSLHVKGTLNQFNGLTQLAADTINKYDINRPLTTPTFVISPLDEIHESSLVRINGLYLVNPSEWTNAGTGFNVNVSDGVNNYLMRIDDQCDLFSSAAPVGIFDAIGIGGQFDNSAPYTTGYQFLPRYIADIIPVQTNLITAFNDSYSTQANTSFVFDPLVNDVIPNGIETFSITTQSDLGNATIGVDQKVTFTPNQDACGTAILTYTICDLTDCSTAQISIDISCPVPTYVIGNINQVDANGVLDSVGVTCSLIGVVHGVNMRSGGLQFTIIDENGDGIGTFSSSENFGYTVNEGDQIKVTGTISQFNGLAQINLSNVELLSSNNPLSNAVGYDNVEFSESKLCYLYSVRFVSPTQWTTGGGSGFNVQVTDGTTTYTIRIDNDVDLFNQTIPFGGDKLMDIYGIGGQFDSSSPYSDGYQLIPRYSQDFNLIVSNEEVSEVGQLTVFPNPTKESVHLTSVNSKFVKVVITNLLGELMVERNFNGAINDLDLNLTTYPDALYIIKVTTDDNKIMTKKIMKSSFDK